MSNLQMKTIPFLDIGGAGPLLHFSHANAYPPESYRQLFAWLTPHYKLVAGKHRPLWPGSDPSDMDDGWHLFATDLIDLFDQQGWRGAIGVGHSMGAVVTLDAAAQRPDLFSALVLVEPVFFPPTMLEAIAQNPGIGVNLPLVKRARRRRNEWKSRQDAFDRFRVKPVFDRLSDEALWDYVNAGILPTHQPHPPFTLAFPPAWEAKIYCHPPFDIWQIVPHISQPILAIRAAETDTLLSPAWAVWRQIQPSTTFIEIAGADHLLPLSHPAQLAQVIHTFLSRLNQTP